jgi:hypothetical protein
MAIDQCPGQDKRFWKPGDVFEAPCPHCGRSIEFWKDDQRRRCRSCGRMAANPKLREVVQVCRAVRGSAGRDGG